MKQMYHTTGHQTFDLTECKVHYVDGKYVVSRPSKWTAGKPQEMHSVMGPVMLRPYLVTEWTEVELEIPGVWAEIDLEEKQ